MPDNLSYAYDANGHTLSDPSAKSYSWDFENRLVQAVVPGTGTTTFRYDPFGRRIQKSGPPGTTNYLYDGRNANSNIIEEVDNSGNVLARYTHGIMFDEPLAEFRGSATSYYQQDGLGSVSSLSNSAGTTANTYVYDSFGQLTTSTGTVINPFHYTGREYDSETGLYGYRLRYYDSNMGRFVSQDPIRMRGGINFYAYVKNRPVIAKDPAGLAMYICTRPLSGFLGTMVPNGNHEFLLDTRNWNTCGMLHQGNEDLTNPNILCTEVPGSDGLEDNVMKCCNKKHDSFWWNWLTWTPYAHDCFNMAGSCLTDVGLPNTQGPGGRIKPCNCGSQERPDHFMSGW